MPAEPPSGRVRDGGDAAPPTRPATPAGAVRDDGAGRPDRGRRGHLLAGTLLAVAVLALLVPFARADPPAGLTSSNAPFTD
jgi:hypothetical protein